MTGVNRVGFVRLTTEGELEYVPDTHLDYITHDHKCFIIVLKDGRHAETTDSKFVGRLMADGVKFNIGYLFEGEPVK